MDKACLERVTMENPKDAIIVGARPEPVPSTVLPKAKRHSWKTLALALVVAGVSDAVSFAISLFVPAQLAVDVVTAGLLFLILGRRLAILPGLIAEAIPGMGIFPVWILVVLSIILYDDIVKIKGSKLASFLRS
jgi:hypothetical protein